MTLADPEQFTAKAKPITYTRVFVELYQQRNRKQVYEIHGMFELEKWHVSTAKNPCNLGTYCIIKVSSVLRNTNIVPRDQDGAVFYVNNYIDQEWFNQLYDTNQFNKNIRNADVMACKLRPASIKATNLKLEVAKDKVQRKQKVVERQKPEAIATK